jgi:hypothetical protein
MKNYLISVLVVFLMVVFTDLNAQIKSGYIIGLNLSTTTLKTSGISLKPELLTGVHLGEVFEISLNNNFALQPGLLLSAKGSINKIDTTEFFLFPIYVEVPVIAVCSFGSDPIKVFLFAGPYFACGIGGKLESGENIRFGSGENDDLKPFDVGLNFGAGINIKGFQVSAQYGLGLANLLPMTSVESEMKNKVIGISVRSLFARK